MTPSFSRRPRAATLAALAFGACTPASTASDAARVDDIADERLTTDDAPACPPSSTRCGPACVDTRVDSDHCGACDTACPASARCVGGRCVDLLQCDGGVRCGWRCLALDTPCQSDGDPGCRGAGTLACVDGGVVCNAQPITDGGCSVVSGARCVARGACLCPSGRTRCDTRCVDLSSDPDNCGVCGNGCRPGPFRQCFFGHCAF